MKFIKTLVFAIVTLGVACGIYYYTVYAEEKSKELLAWNKKVVKLEKDQINYFEIQNKSLRYVLLKNDKGWNIQEPVVDVADTEQINSVIEQLTDDSLVDVAKDYSVNEVVKWEEFGLDKSEQLIVLKNNLGQSRKIIISEMKNFEGNFYAKIDNENRILILKPFWQELINKKIVFFREKKIFRKQLELVKKVSVTSLSDHFTLIKKEDNWESEESPEKILDQNKVRHILKNITETKILDYVQEGEPSIETLKEKSLDKNFVQVYFEGEGFKWAAKLNMNQADNSLYALTEYPTYLVTVEPIKWEVFGNLTLDSLRDRKSLMKFKLDLVSSIFFKYGQEKHEFFKKNNMWIYKNDEKRRVDTSLVSSILEKINNFELTYFLEEKDAQEFSGQDMIILRSDSEQLLFQFNWGPLVKKKIQGIEKEFFLARTQVSDLIFGFDKEDIESLNFKKAVANEEN